MLLAVLQYWDYIYQINIKIENKKFKMSVTEKFRGANIPKKEIDVLKIIEHTIKYPRTESHEKFKLVNSIENFNIDKPLRVINYSSFDSALFVVKNNRVSSLSIIDPNVCDSCIDKDTGWRPSDDDCARCGIIIPESISIFTALEELYIVGNSLVGCRIPDSLFELISLKILFLDRVGLSRGISEKIGNLKSLISLHLPGNRLQEIPESITNLNSLINLDLSQNRLSELPSSLSGLKNLRVLNLRKNSLNELPNSITDLSNLQVLNLYRNKLTSLPQNIEKMESLKKLTLEENNLTSLPENIGDLSSLCHLNISKNQITKIPDSLINKNIVIRGYP